MKRRFIKVFVLVLVLIGLIFFAVKANPADNEHEGVFVEQELTEGWLNA